MRNARAVVLEALLVALVGLGFGLLANTVSPLGLRLGRDYFPGAPVTGSTISSNSPASITNSSALAAQRLRDRGLQLISSNEVANSFRDSRYEQGLFVFVDARDDQHYQAGHVPGAWQFNHYRAEQFLPTVLPLCLSAQKVVVYCSGGACEDSEFAAIMLREGGVPPDNLFVYTGGIAEWKTNGLPVEIGPRGSGQFTKPNP